MALPTTYNTGTATIAANDTAVTGQGTTWLTSGIQAGDLFMAAGLSVVIAAVNSNTSITLADPWPGGARATASYRIQFTPDATRVLATTRAMLDALTNGNLYSIANLATAADKVPYFTGAGTSALADFTAFARSLVGAASAAAARTTLQLGSAALLNIGTSGAAIGRLDTANTWSNGQLFGAATGDAFFSLEASLTGVPFIRARKGGLTRWQFNIGTNSAESGGNVGSDFQINRYDDSGTFIGQALGINRSTGIITANSGLNVNGGSLAMASGTSIAFGGSAAAATRTNLGLGSAALESIGTSGSAVGKLNTQNIWSAPQIVGDATGDAQLRINSAVGNAGYIRGMKAAVSRWVLMLGDGAAESGSNAGSNFSISRQDDTGVTLDYPFAISRATGVASFVNPPKIPSFTVATLPSAAANPQGIVYVSNGTGNKRFAISDGTNWRFPDGAIVS